MASAVNAETHSVQSQGCILQPKVPGSTDDSHAVYLLLATVETKHHRGATPAAVKDCWCS